MKISNRLNRKYMQISLYVIMTCIIIYILSLVAKNAPDIIKDLIVRLRWVVKILKPIIIGLVFAYLLAPIIKFFERLYLKIKFIKKTRTAHILAVVTSVFLFILIVAIIISLLVYSVTNQIRLANLDDIIVISKQLINNVDGFYQTLLSKLNELDVNSTELENYFNQASTHIIGTLKNISKKVGESLGNISGNISTMFFSFIIGIYIMIDGEMIKKYVRKVRYALLRKESNQRLSNIFEDLDRVFSGYIRGQLTDALFMMVAISITLSIIDVKFALLIGVLTGIGNLVPYMGPLVAYFGTTLVCVVNGEYKKLLIAIIILAIVQAIDGNFVNPKLLSNAIRVHPLIIIVSLIIGSAIGGFLGMLLAVPVGGYVKLVFVRYIERCVKKKESLYDEEYSDEEHVEIINAEEVSE